MPAATTLAIVGLGLSAAAAGYQTIQSKKSADEATDRAEKQQKDALALEEQKRLDEERAKQQAASIEQRQIQRQLNATPKANTVPNLSAGISGSGKQLIGQ